MPIYQKITDMNPINNIDDTDLIEIVDDVAGTPTSKKSNFSTIKTWIQGFVSVINTQVLTDATNILWDTSQGSFATVTLTGNRTLDNPINLTTGTYKLKVIQDGTGGRTLVFGTYFKFPGGVEPVLSNTAGAVDILEFIAYSSTEIVLVNFLSDIQ